MKVLLLLAIPALAAAQLSITYSRQEDAIPKAYIGTVPKTIALYMATTCNDTAMEQRFFPDRVIQEAAKNGPVEDGAATLFAAQTYKASTLKAIGLDAARIIVMGASGYAAATSGNTLGTVAAALGGVSTITGFLSEQHQKAISLVPPANWWMPHQPERILKAGECDVILFPMSKTVPEKFIGAISTPLIPASGTSIPANVPPPPPSIPIIIPGGGTGEVQSPTQERPSELALAMILASHAEAERVMLAAFPKVE